MSRRLILILTIILILIIGVLLYLRLIKDTGGDNTNTNQSGSGISKNLLPLNTNNSSKDNLGTNDGPLIIGTSNGIDATDSNENSNTLPRLRHYTTVPTSGDIVLERERDVIKDRVKVKEKGYYVRYMDRATGHIFESKTDETTTQKISNTTIPKVYEAIFTPSGNSLIARFLDRDENISTYYITLKNKAVVATSTKNTATTTATVNSKSIEEKSILKDAVGTYLTSNIKELAMSPSGTKILESLYGGNGGIIALLDSNNKSRTILSHPLREWLLSIPSETKAVITTKPSGASFGFSYLLDLATGNMKKIVGSIYGLTILPNKNLSTYIVGEASNNLFKISIFSETETKDISLKTLPEKCVWSNKSSELLYCAVPNNKPFGMYPDDWYKGKVSFEDSLWSINTKSGETKFISDLAKESGQSIDAINLYISSDDKYMTFINKIDLTVWGIDLTLKK
jgi:hypothetical protein